MDEVDLHVLYRLLLPAARNGGLITYGQLSEQYDQQPDGFWVDPHLGWRLPLAQIDFRCAGLCQPGHRPILSAIVVTDPEATNTANPGRPGQGFWDLHTPGGVRLTPAVPSEDEWVAMCGAVYNQAWPAELDGLPA